MKNEFSGSVLEEKKLSGKIVVDLTSGEFAEDIDVGTTVVSKENYDEKSNSMELNQCM